MNDSFTAVEICAGAGGQVLGLHEAGFTHKLAVELDSNACATLRHNGLTPVAEGDAADSSVWNPQDYEGVTLLAGGVPCPPFTIAGKQLGAVDERDLFAWAVEQVPVIKPRALLLENVRGLSMPRFAGYRQRILDKLTEYGYVGDWQLLQASDFSVPQLRPRFVLVAMKLEDAEYFHWPDPADFDPAPTVGQALFELMGDWKGADDWKGHADKIAPTIVGGSKKHGGADLGPTRAKRAWAQMHVDAMGLADAPPAQDAEFAVGPKLTCDMVEVLQGFAGRYEYSFTGRKTSRYRQIGNAFPPPVAHAVGSAIIDAFHRRGPRRPVVVGEHDPIYKALFNADDFLSASKLTKIAGVEMHTADLERHISMLSKDFTVETVTHGQTTKYKLSGFNGFTGQESHLRHEAFLKNRAKIS
ncbi:DNA (cytosine-5-)-methyltransferase [Saccharopolyspora sp. NPDC047091]|uniref:DNA cytosine methyltransferase n=1 Tax=Saccharopolyspora sp. NPDC047091 TaxID=3155924 RepID=UPI0033EF20D6